MAADRPNQSENGANRAAAKSRGVVDTIVRAERMTQIAFILPAAVLVGWLAGAGLDRWLHQHWIYLVGIILGCVAGFIEIFRLVLGPEKSSNQAKSEKE